MKPPMPYSGGKQRIAAQIVNALPPHAGYVEPFAGALSVLLAKPPSSIEVVNDINGDLVTFWRVLRDRPYDLERACALTPHSRSEYRLCDDKSIADDVERARRVWVQLTQSRAASMRATAGWRFTHGGNGMALSAYLDGYVARISPAAERLRHVSIECRPALDIIRSYGHHAKNLLYLDPPYLGDTRSSSTNQYVHEMRSIEDHEELLAAVADLPAIVAISGYAHPLYDDILAGWRRTEFRAYSAMGTARTEVLWVNRQPQQRTLA